MAMRLAKGVEPIPGYVLVERLGQGGFGEVWKAEAPGGLLKAIKLVHGTLFSAIGEEEHVQKELKSLNCVKSVRHPYILSLDRYDVVSGQLLIVMELADRSLWDRLQQCRTQGLQGIPRNELLHYMAEAAEALDLMNLRYGLQHSDIKPQNLFLVHHHVKVADFGLVRDLQGMKAAETGGVSPLYAAPETFEGLVTRFSDQYSLAIVYQELLTGQRPFDGTNGRQLLMQHTQMEPDLTSLPASDQPAVRRALTKDPADRFSCCGAFVQALRTGDSGRVQLFRSAEVAARVVAGPAAPRRSTLDGRPIPAPPGPDTPMPDSRKLAPVSNGGTAVALERPPAPPQPAPAAVMRPSAIAVRCPGCSCAGQVPHVFKGRPVKCRECGLVFPVIGFADAASKSGDYLAAAKSPEAKSAVPEMEAPTSILIDIECPACGNVGPIPETYRGRRLKCRQCGCVHRDGLAPAGS
jgi:eukaryotic-like serine/threonine-protein kinase